MVKVEALSGREQKFVKHLGKSFKENGSGLTRLRLAQLAGVAILNLHNGKRREDKLANAVARGMPVRENMAAEEGGSMSADEAARELGVSKQSVLNMYHAGKVLAWRTEKQGAVRFPVWQFSGNRRIDGLAEALSKLSECKVLDDWARIGFFLQTHGILNDRRPLDLLREKKLELVLKAAGAYAE